jgi:hypothetical protein
MVRGFKSGADISDETFEGLELVEELGARNI